MKHSGVLFLLAAAAFAQQFPAIEFVKIPAGTFLMGCAPGDSPYAPDGTSAPCHDNEKPPHRVAIVNAFEIGKFEITQAQWRAVMGDNPSFFKGDDLPVEQVSWDGAQEFLRRLTARNDGFRYRLPSEAEWEYVARAGSAGQFPESPGLSEMAWYGAGGPYLTESKGTTHPVGTKLPNAWGVYDMRGNVSEWVEDLVAEPSGKYHQARGGSWYSTAAYLRASNRYPCACTARRDIGFRIVREPISSSSPN